jgi:HAMP domain-containing protein
MRLRTKFNLVLFMVFLVSLVITGLISYRMLHHNARDEVIQNAGIMMQAAFSMRGYTVQQVKPLLEMQLQRVFLPQSVPAYAATEIFNMLRTNYADYTYKEATLNPTNPRDRATDWEADIVQKFRNDSSRLQIIGERDTPTGKSLYLARPIQIKDQNCLVCHSTVDAAPETMIKLYGTANGFGWQHNEIVGAQIVSIPMSVPIQKATSAFYTFMGSLLGIFVLIFVVLNLMLNSIIVKPLARMAQLADEISTGSLNLPEFPATGKDEVSVLARSFNRLRRSLEKAMKMMEET